MFTMIEPNQYIDFINRKTCSQNVQLPEVVLGKEENGLLTEFYGFNCRFLIKWLSL